MCDELKQANKIIKKLHDSNQEQTQKVLNINYIYFYDRIYIKIIY